MAMSPSVRKIDVICAKLKTSRDKSEPMTNNDLRLNLGEKPSLNEGFSSMPTEWILNKQRNRRKAAVPRSIFHLWEPSEDDGFVYDNAESEENIGPPDVDPEDTESEMSDHYESKFSTDYDKEAELTGKETLSPSPENWNSVETFPMRPEDKVHSGGLTRPDNEFECTIEATPLDLSVHRDRSEPEEIIPLALKNIPENTSSSSSSSSSSVSSSSSSSYSDSQNSDIIPSQNQPSVRIPLSTSTNDISKRSLNKRFQKLCRLTNGGAGHSVALKDYAETTMNELLNLYGLSEGQSLQRPPIPVTSALLKIPNHSESSAILSLAKGSLKPIVTSNDLEKKTTCEPISSISQMPYASNAPATSFLNTKENENKFFDNQNISPNIVKLVQAVPNSISSSSSSSSSSSTTYIPDSISFLTKGNFLPNQSVCKLSSNPDRLGIRKVINTDYTKYLKRFGNSAECAMPHCKEMHYREHYHCLDCSFKIFSKKEEMVRHFKWHKKRDDSLQYGFMRYSPLDDCSFTYPNCAHNHRQTHYHCLQQSCDKVYISTSDVQMHANYHRKDSAIIQEGFQRFRATEDCGTMSCSFHGQRTTHFHCRRSDCKFTFKNKADMEKHKSYHQKDELLGRDGFKKFMKYEHCKFPQCRFSKVSNHIHCIRSECNYILHSTAQLYSHKRKHERRDFENAYRRFQEVRRNKTIQIPSNYPKLLGPQAEDGPNTNSPSIGPSSQVYQKVALEENLGENTVPNENNAKTESPTLNEEEFESKNKEFKKEILENEEGTETNDSVASCPNPNLPLEETKIKRENPSPPSSSALMAHPSDLSGDSLNDSLSLPIPLSGRKTHINDNHIVLNVHQTAVAAARNSLILSPEQSSKVAEKKEKHENWKLYLVRYTANDPCNPRCDLLYKDHYHCQVSGCAMTYRSKDGVREHARFHELQDQISSMSFVFYEENEACIENCQLKLKSKHYHCKWPGCNISISSTSEVFARLEHYHMHHNSQIISNRFLKYPLVKSEIDIARPRRGRPPKYPRIDIPLMSKVHSMSHNYHVTQFNEENPSVNASSEQIADENFILYREKEPCSDEDCMYLMKEHYHCSKPRCHHVTDRLDLLSLHTKDFHNFVHILEGYEFFDQNVNCHQEGCPNNKVHKHFHCSRPQCDYTFLRHNMMVLHDKKHNEKQDSVSSSSLSPSSSICKRAVTSFVPIMPAVSKMALQPTSKAVIKSSGTFYPISTIPTCQARPLTSITQPQLQTNTNQMVHSSLVNMSLPLPTIFTSSIGTPLMPPSESNLLNASETFQQKAENFSGPTNWESIKEKLHYSLHQNCGRPFCKLKKRDHYHCVQCNQAFSEPLRLQYHMNKHRLKLHDNTPHGSDSTTLEDVPNDESAENQIKETNKKLDRLDEEVEKNNEAFLIPRGLVGHKNYAIENLPSILIGLPNLSTVMTNGNITTMTNCFPNQQELSMVSLPEPKIESKDFAENKKPFVIKKEQHFPLLKKDPLMTELNYSQHLVRKRLAAEREQEEEEKEENPDIPKPKVRRIHSGPVVSGVSEKMPDGYIRVKYSEDCRYTKCTYKHMVTHFHCQRSDCGYGFSDRSRIVQHKLRHERIDSITGGDFKQFRSNMECLYNSCEYSCKSSHYHCLKCDFVCTDTTKVTAHRKFHIKMENIASHGFQKYFSHDLCQFPSCNYNQKQTHYHCMQVNCNYTVLGLSQMTTHKFKHIAESAEFY